MKRALLALLAACGESPSMPDPDSGPQGSDSGSNAQCAPACFEQRWWMNVGATNCNVLCMAAPSAPECAQPDCEQVSAQIYAGGMLRTLGPLLHSAANHSFYLLGGVTSESYTATADCKLQVGTKPQSSFTCSGDSLTFSVGQFTAASAAQAVALDQAASANTVGEYRY